MHPFIYTPSVKKIVVYNSLTVTLSKTSTSLAKISSSANPRLDEIFQNVIINRNSVAGLQKNMATSANRDPKALLIILSEKWSDCKSIVDEYAKWKHSSGVYTTLITTAQTGSTVDQIKAYIKKAYEDKAHPLTDVILVGDLRYSIKRIRSLPLFG